MRGRGAERGAGARQGLVPEPDEWSGEESQSVRALGAIAGKRGADRVLLAGKAGGGASGAEESWGSDEWGRAAAADGRWCDEVEAFWRAEGAGRNQVD